MLTPDGQAAAPDAELPAPGAPGDPPGDGPGSAPADASAEPADALPRRYREWLASVETLITDEERAYFLSLSEGFRREEFIRAFWRQRDPLADTGGMNELQVHWEERVEEALLRWGTLEDARADFHVRHGEPWVRCLHPRKEFEIWTYYVGPWPMPAVTHDEQFFRVFFWAPAPGEPYRRWSFSGFFQPVTRRRLPDVPSDQLCSDGALPATGLYPAGEEPREPDTAFTLEIPRPSEEWVAAFAAATTDLPPGAPSFETDLAFEFPGRHQQRTVVQGVLLVDRSQLAAFDDGAGKRLYHLLLIGEVVREDALFERFRYRFEIPEGASAGDRLPLVFQRYLRPGEVRLLLKLEDLYGRRFARVDERLVVPPVRRRPPDRVALPRLEDAEIFRLLAAADEATRRGERSLELVPPPGLVHSGMVRFSAVTVGELDRVDFLLDGQPIFTKRRPPYSVELNLGSVPQAHRLRAEGYDAAGELAASDELILNPGGQRFRVRITEPRPGHGYRDSLRAAVQVVVPDGEELDRVELYLDEERVATLYQPPWVQPILLDGAPLVFLRAVAYLTDGNATEDSVLINAPGELDEIQVNFVELYAAVYDRRGRPVLGLTGDDFTVLEDGEPQTARRFEWVDDLPLHAALLIDTSASMEESLPGVAEAARTFLSEVIAPRDRATLIPFNHEPRVAVGFTNDVGVLAGQLAALRAWGSTSIYDSLIFALQYFQGVKGQKALLLLSDGEDESSHFDFDAALEAAHRAGVTIYSIWLREESELKRPARRVLERLAEETGGRAFFAAAVDELPAIYASIQQELRSQYLFAYQSTSTKDPSEFRRIEVIVEVGGRRADVRTIAGYYP